MDLNSNRVSNPIYQEKNNYGNEMYYFKRLITLIKEKYPTSNCTFIFLTKNIEETIYEEEYKLLLIKASKPIETYNTCHIDIVTELYKNKDFIQKYL